MHATVTTAGAAAITRRDFVVTTLAAVAGVTAERSGAAATNERIGMYGLIGKMNAQPGQREALAAILFDATTGMPGCLSYVIALDTEQPDALWITEVWDSEASHGASLKLPKIQAAIGRARPMIAGFGERFVTSPLGGTGLR